MDKRLRCKITRLGLCLFGVIGLFLNHAHAQAPAFNLAVGVGTTTAGIPAAGIVHTSNVQKTAVDGGGNIYVVGRFQWTVDFGSISLTSAGDYDLFIAKLSPTGQFLWAKRAGSTGDDAALGLVIDVNGNVYVAGYYRLSATFGNTTLSGSSATEGFVTKLDAQGNYRWAVPCAGSAGFGASLALDPSGNLLMNGGFSGATAQFGTITLANSGTPQAYVDNAFVAKLDTTGNFLWAKRTGHRSGDVTTDAFDNVYVAGSFGGTDTFGPFTLTVLGNGMQDAFVAKLDPAGNWLWVRNCGSTSYDYGSSVGVDYAGNVFLTGGFYPPTGIFGNITVPNRGRGNFDAFVAKLDASGNWLWAVGAGGTNNDYAASVAVDDDGSAYVLGGYQDFGSGGTFGTIVLPNLNRQYGQLFVGKISDSGSWQWVTTTTGAYSDYPVHLTLDRRGGVYLAGSFSGSARSFSSTTLTGNPGTTTGFVARLWDSMLPRVVAVTPPQGAAGTQVTIQGARFTGATAVMFNGVAATAFIVTSPTTISTTVPAGATTGPVSVNTAAGTGAPGTVFQVGGTLATGEPAASSFSYWPNPIKSGGTLRLKQAAGGFVVNQAELYNLQGKLVAKNNLTAQSIDLPALPAGVYLLRISAVGAQPRSFRIVVE